MPKPANDNKKQIPQQLKEYYAAKNKKLAKEILKTFLKELGK